MADEERASTQVPKRELCQRMKKAGAEKGFQTFKYEEEPGIFHNFQLSLLSKLLDFMWDKTAAANEADRIDMRLTLTNGQLVAVSSLAEACSFLIIDISADHD